MSAQGVEVSPTSAPSLRPMREGDLDAVMAIEQRAYPFPWTEGIMRDCFKFGYTCKVYESRDGIIGYGIVSIAAGECHFLNICIAPSQQQQGHGAGWWRTCCILRAMPARARCFSRCVSRTALPSASTIRWVSTRSVCARVTTRRRTGARTRWC